MTSLSPKQCHCSISSQFPFVPKSELIHPVWYWLHHKLNNVTCKWLLIAQVPNSGFACPQNVPKFRAVCYFCNTILCCEELSAQPLKLNNRLLFVFASYVYSQPPPYLEAISIHSLRTPYLGSKGSTWCFKSGSGYDTEKICLIVSLQDCISSKWTRRPKRYVKLKLIHFENMSPNLM
jgi:hypothetical protein